jgi:adenylate cyclase
MQMPDLTVRQIRLASGLVLFAYVSTHLANHAAGIVSLQAAEVLRRIFLAAWRNPVSTFLLYGALLVHFVLGLYAIYRRRTLRIPARELAQLSLGLAIPLLMLDHVKGTRVAFELYGQTDSYARVVWDLWRPAEGLRQAAMLGAVWTHGCLGLHFLLRYRAWYPRYRTPLLLLAIALPALALFGFWSIGRELALLSQDQAWFDEHMAPLFTLTSPERSALKAIESAFEWAYGGVLVALVGAMAIRSMVERVRRTLVSVRYPGGRTVAVPRGFSVLEASRRGGIPHTSVCGGRGRCSTCRVRILSSAGELPRPRTDEQRTLARIGAPENVRLACQLRPHGDLAVVPLVELARSVGRAGGASEASFGVEREVAILFIDLRGWTGRSEGYLPFDLVYVLNRYFETVGAAVRRNGGIANQFIGDAVMAIFGRETDPRAACRQALSAALDISRGMALLNQGLERDGFKAFDFGIGIDAGPVVIGEFGYREVRTLSAAGDTVNTASRLQELTKACHASLVLSSAVCRYAGLDLARGGDAVRASVQVRGRTGALEVFVVREMEAIVAARSQGRLGDAAPIGSASGPATASQNFPVRSRFIAGPAADHGARARIGRASRAP